VARPLRMAADLTLRIPYDGTFNHSLGTAAAAAIIAFEVLRQRTWALSYKGKQCPPDV
jgi:hypothetical protein